MRIMPGGALESSSDESNKISSIFVGQKLDEHRGAFYLEYPMDKGMITDSGWNAMTRLWEVGFEMDCFCFFRRRLSCHSNFALFFAARLFKAMLKCEAR